MDRLVMNPSGAYPLTMVDLVVGALTAAGKLSLLMEYAAATMEDDTSAQIEKAALDFLLDG